MPIKHGLSNHLLYGVWCSMIRRCTKIKDKDYVCYGGRGISVYTKWRSDFMAFYNWSMENGYIHGLEIDRKDNNGDYEPGNCRFVTRTVNNRNTRTNRIIEYKGEKKCLNAWAEYIGISRCTLRDRLDYSKWSVEKAFTTPLLNNQTRAAWK